MCWLNGRKLFHIFGRHSILLSLRALENISYKIVIISFYYDITNSSSVLVIASIRYIRECVISNAQDGKVGKLYLKKLFSSSLFLHNEYK